MAPKVDISEKTINDLVRCHLEKESNETHLRRHARKHGANYAKLALAIGGLTLAVNGYTNLQKDNLELSKQNRVLFQAVATKVNNMAERLAYMEGRMEGMKHEEAKKAVKDKVKPMPKPKSASSMKAKAKTMDKPPEHDWVGEAAGEEFDVLVAVEGKPQVQMMAPLIQLDAYEQLPEDLGELMEQAQEQMQEN